MSSKHCTTKDILSPQDLLRQNELLKSENKNLIILAEETVKNFKHEFKLFKQNLELKRVQKLLQIELNFVKKKLQYERQQTKKKC